MRPMTQSLASLGHRWIAERDFEEVLWIDLLSHEYAWTADDFRENLRQRNCIGMVAEFERQVVGFYVYETYAESYKLLRLAVHPDFRRLGVGRKMLQKMESKIRDGQRNQLTIELRESLLPAQFFLRSCGFKAVNVLRNHYDNPCEDAYVFIKRREGLAT
jgi:[ribosomal protein S18]-alanine N-acetyltransferase